MPLIKPALPKAVIPPPKSCDAALDFKSSGVLDVPALLELATSEPDFFVGELMREQSITLLVGDSGLGKTPLAMSLAVAVSSATPFLGHEVRQRNVLYFDAESGAKPFARLLERVSENARLLAPPPAFHSWLAQEAAPSSVNWGEQLFRIVERLSGWLIIVDPLRLFFPQVEMQSSDAAVWHARMRQIAGSNGNCFFVIHHLRKRREGFNCSLEDTPTLWLEEAAGSRALVNHADTRLGVEEDSGNGADLVMAGFVRGEGQVGPYRIARVRDDAGLAIGYRLLAGVEHLGFEDRGAFDKLAPRFRFTDAKVALGGRSDSAAAAFLKQVQAVGLVRRDGRGYVKVPLGGAGASGDAL